MPSAIDQIKVIPLHPTFCAEVQGVDFSKPTEPHVIQQIQEAIDEVDTDTAPCIREALLI